MRHRRVSSACLEVRQISTLRDSLHADLKRHPDWPDLWNLRGLLLAYEGQYERAVGDFREAVRINPAYRRAHWNLRWAEVLANPSAPFGGDPDAAAGALQPAGLLARIHGLLRSAAPPPDPVSPEPELGFALLAVRSARPDTEEFRKTLQTFRARHAELDELFRAAGLGSLDAPDCAQLAELGRPERLNPGYCDLLAHAARLEALSDREEVAMRLFALAAILQGSRAAYLLEKAEMLSRARRTDEILPLLREAVEAEPDSVRAHAALGYELSVQGVLDEALRHLEKAVALQPGYADVLYQYGLLLHAAGRNEEAIATMHRALELARGYLVARIALANLLFEEKREAEAAPHYTQVFEEGIETPSLAGRFGYSLHAAGSRNRAEELFLEAISQDRERPDLLCLYGMFLAETDRRLEARTVWERALRCQPSRETRARIETMLADAAPEN